jgi:hypothetical protein
MRYVVEERLYIKTEYGAVTSPSNCIERFDREVDVGLKVPSRRWDGSVSKDAVLQSLRPKNLIVAFRQDIAVMAENHGIAASRVGDHSRIGLWGKLTIPAAELPLR